MKLEISCLPGEYWWGGAVGDGIRMPYAKKDMERDLNGWVLNNQASASLMSNTGRYVFINGMKSCTGEYETAIGKFSIQWNRISSEKVKLEIVTPQNADAVLKLKGYVTENNRSSICKLKSGKNTFVCRKEEQS